MTGRRVDVTVVSVTYQSEGMIGESLQSAIAAAAEAGLELEVIVVDNESTDASASVAARVAPGATIIRNADNRGFGMANQQAFEIASGAAWLLLNPDARIERDALRILVNVLDARPRAGAVAPSIGAPGTGAESAGMLPSLRSSAGHFLFLNRLLPAGRGGSWQGFQVPYREGRPAQRVGWASAACLLVRPQAIREVGGFDPSIFLYGEDVELGARLDAAGWEIWLEPSARAHHAIAGSQGGVTTRWLDGIHRFYARRANRLQVALFDTVVALGLAARGVLPARGPDGALRRRRMRAGARRAVALAAGSLIGRRTPELA